MKELRSLVFIIKKDGLNMIVINDDYRLLKGENVKEGGLARNEAIIDWLKRRKNAEEIKLDGSRGVNGLSIIRFLKSVRGETVLFLYPTVGIPLLKNGIVGRCCANLFLTFLKRASSRNRIIVDVCDLKYEQAIDLEIDLDRREAFRETEEKLFNTDCEFVFASESMMNYAKKKYNINGDRCHVLDNGGSLKYKKTDFSVAEDKKKLIYAGTLNRGRNIEKMIDCVRASSDSLLYLCGTGGEWIKNDENIVYLGSLDEESAHYVVSQCDLGLIPYDESRKYYNIAYPTKLAFYVTGGIPFISTNVTEVRRIKEKYGIGYIGEIDKWENIVRNLSLNDLKVQKEKALTIQNEFTWEYKCSASVLNTL